jgi:hypothetical protein
MVRLAASSIRPSTGRVPRRKTTKKEKPRRSQRRAQFSPCDPMGCGFYGSTKACRIIHGRMEAPCPTGPAEMSDRCRQVKQRKNSDTTDQRAAPPASPGEASVYSSKLPIVFRSCEPLTSRLRQMKGWAFSCQTSQKSRMAFARSSLESKLASLSALRVRMPNQIST